MCKSSQPSTFEHIVQVCFPEALHNLKVNDVALPFRAMLSRTGAGDERHLVCGFGYGRFSRYSSRTMGSMTQCPVH